MTINFPRRSGQPPQRVEMFEAWAPRFPNTNSNLAAAADELVKGYRAFSDAHHRAMADETITPGARQVRSAKAARAKLVPLVERLDAAAQDAATVLASLNSKVSTAFNPPDKKFETIARHQEIRAHFKALSQGERLAAIDAARTSGDDDTLVALACYQPFLSGLQPQVHQMTRDHLIEVHAPAEAATLKALAEQQVMTQSLRDTMLQTVSDLVDFQKADEMIAAAKDELAA